MEASLGDSLHFEDFQARPSNAIENVDRRCEVQQVSAVSIDIKQEYSSEVFQNQDDLSATMMELPIKSEIWVEAVKIEPNADSVELVEPFTSKDTNKQEEGTLSKELVTQRDSSDDDSYEELPSKKSQNKLAGESLIDHCGLSCSLCDRKAKTFSQIRLHFRKKHNRPDAYVVCCGKKFDKKYRLMDHFRQESHEISPCALCTVKFMTPQALNTHLSEGKGRYTCNECLTSFKQKCAFDEHKKRHWAFRCSKCDGIFKTCEALFSHIELQHNGVDRSIECETCGRKFLSKKSLSYHKRSQHSGAVMFRCEVCQQWLKTKQNYKRHMDYMHGPNKDEKIVCEICQKEFSYKKALLTHKRNVHVEEMYGCDLCDKKFKRRISLTNHRRTHKDVAAFQCEYCSYKTKNRSCFYVHAKNSHPEEWAEKRLKRGDNPVRRHDFG